MNSKRKRIVSAMLLMTMSITLFSTNVFAGGSASVVTNNPKSECCNPSKSLSSRASYNGNNDSTGQTPITLPSGTDVNGSENNIINGSNNVIINQIQAPVSTKESTDEKEGHLVIGKEIENKKIEDIVSISKDEIKSVTIKNCVTSICESAFAGCTELTSVTIGNGVTGIGSSAFSGCMGLTSVNIPNGVTYIGDGALNDCKGLTSVTIGNCVTYIGDCAFRGCVGLTSITIPNSVTSIGKSAFQDCPSLTSVTIGKGVKKIGERAFYDCHSLEEVTVPKSVTEIGKEAFDKNCVVHLIVGKDIENKVITSIVSISRDEIKSVIIEDGVASIVSSAFEGCTGLTSITIPNSVTKIGDRAFSGCTGLTSITIPNSVTYIGDCAFSGCTGLTSITIPNSVKYICAYTFYGCTGLTSVTIPNSVTSIGHSAFSGCTGLTSITIPNSVTYIGDCAFEGCTGLTSITIPNSVTYIGDCAFEGCTGLTSITIPNSVTSIGRWAFYGCTGLTSINVDEKNPNYKSIDGILFSKAGKSLIQYPASKKATNYIIPDSVTSIGSSAFEGCTGLTSINVDEKNPNYKSIDGILFSKAGKSLIQYPASKKATNYIIPDSVTSIGYRAFSGCTGLTSITIPDSVTEIGDNAFNGCTGLTSITIPNSVTKIGDRAFSGCTGLTSINVDEKNPNYKSIDGVLFSKAGKSLIQYPASKKATNYIIPDSVTSIGDCAFEGCTGLTSINVDEKNPNYKSIDGILFSKAGKSLIQYPAGKKATNYIIPDSVTYIDGYAFYGCRGLTSVTIPNSVTEIGEGTFSDCTGLTSVTIPNSVKFIGSCAFDKNTKVTRK